MPRGLRQSLCIKACEAMSHCLVIVGLGTGHWALNTGVLVYTHLRRAHASSRLMKPLNHGCADCSAARRGLRKTMMHASSSMYGQDMGSDG
jgi:hypothetical protein